jgi:hypothetical protein
MHEDSALDIQYHDTINAVGTMQGYISVALQLLQETGGNDEVILCLQKAQKKYPQVKELLYSDYLERKRQENVPKPIAEVIIA